jgi:hypothetical protein
LKLKAQAYTGDAPVDKAKFVPIATAVAACKDEQGLICEVLTQADKILKTKDNETQQLTRDKKKMQAQLDRARDDGEELAQLKRAFTALTSEC